MSLTLSFFTLPKAVDSNNVSQSPGLTIIKAYSNSASSSPQEDQSQNLRLRLISPLRLRKVLWSTLFLNHVLSGPISVLGVGIMMGLVCTSHWKFSDACSTLQEPFPRVKALYSTLRPATVVSS